MKARVNSIGKSAVQRAATAIRRRLETVQAGKTPHRKISQCF